MELLRLLLNLLWLVVSGFWNALAYAFFGVIMCILIITIPFGVASFRLAGYSLWPFGRTVMRKPDAGLGSAIGNVLWFILAGVWLALGQFVLGVSLCLTIIGIPFGIANFKLARLSLNPLGKQVVPVEVAEAGGWQAFVPVQ